MRKQKPRARKQAITKVEMVRVYDRDYPKASAAEVAKALGFTKQQVWGIRNQLKKRDKAASDPKARGGVYDSGWTTDRMKSLSTEAKKKGFSRMDIIQLVLLVGIDRMQETLNFMTGE